MRTPAVFALGAATALGSALITWALIHPVSVPVDSSKPDEVARLRSEVDSLNDAVRLIASSQSSPKDAATVERAREVVQFASAPLAGATESSRDPQRTTEMRLLVAFLWRCMHDKDGLMAMLEARHLSPFDADVLELTQETYARIDELRTRFPFDLEGARRRRALANDLEEDIKSGRTPSEERSRIQQQVDHLRNTEDPRLGEYESELKAIVDGFAQRLPSKGSH